MAAPPAPPLRASWSSRTAVAATPRVTRPIHVAAMHLRHTPGRRGPSSAPVKMQARTRDSFRSYCEKRADHLHQPEPENAGVSEKCGLAQLLNYKQALGAAMGTREPPDMFRKEKDEISKYMMEICSSPADDQVMALAICTEAQKALDLASMIMDLTDIASLDLGATEISHHTAKQMVRMYTPTFCDVAEDACHKRIKMDKVLSFLDALRGLGAICRIVVQETVAMLKDGPMEDNINSDLRKHSHEFDKKLNNLKERSMVATETNQTVVMDILHDGMKHADSYISQLVGHRRVAISALNLAKLSLMRAYLVRQFDEKQA